MGDMATLRVLATVDDETLVDQEAWDYQLRENEAPSVPIPGLSRRLVGLRKGDVKDETIDLPPDYVPSSYGGKQLALHVEVLKIERKRAPEVDDSFAQNVAKVDSLAILRERLTASMQAQAQRRAEDAYVEKVVAQVVEQAVVSVPPPLVDDELDDMMHHLQETVERERKISMDTYARILGKTVEQVRADARPNAEHRVRTDLVLDAIAKAEGIEAPSSEIDAQVRLLASQPTYSNKERRRLLASDALRQRIATKLQKRYVITRLLEIASPGDHADMAESVESVAQGVPATMAVEETPESVQASTSAQEANALGQQNEEEN
jgi:trigger factor